MQVCHDPRQCHVALARTAGPVVLDLETTGLRRHNRIVSAGLLVDDTAYVLFVRSSHVSIDNRSLTDFLKALEPLNRNDLRIIAHNALFDLGFLLREGIRVGGEVHDTLKLLRLIDQDRGGERDSSAKRQPRRDLTAPEDAPVNLDCKLKHVASQLLSIKMPHFPGNIELAPYKTHATYLACDLIGTKKLHDYLWPRLTADEKTYYQTMVAPLIPIMLGMANDGMASDPTFIRSEGDRLQNLWEDISARHASQFGRRLGKDEGMDQAALRDWLYNTLKLPIVKYQCQGKRSVPSLDSKVLKALETYSENSRTKGSLKLILDYRAAASLLARIRTLLKHVDRKSGRIYSSFDDRQATGRISSTVPNLQQIAKAKTIDGQEFRSRNALRASPGYELVVFDIAQADIRVLAHAVESFPTTARKHLTELRHQRQNGVDFLIGSYLQQMRLQANPNFKGQLERHPEFDPAMPADLAADFQTGQDFYTTAATRIMGRQPQDKAERNRYKAIILSIVNGLGVPSLARTMDVTEAAAKGFMQQFEKAYPKVAAYKQLMYHQIALTGRTKTFMGRVRTVTAHRWMVTEAQVQILVSYRGGEAYWLDVVPLRPGFRVLTTYVLQAWNARTNRLIYDHQRGRLTNRRYSIFEADELQYRLPIRNWGWRSIRRVRARGQESDYEGFDATARCAFNFICQGGTADISKLMMIRSQPLCDKFGARLLIQIHDELVFEVPDPHADEFLTEMKKVLEEPPVPDFMVPIVVEPKRGRAFGSLVTV